MIPIETLTTLLRHLGKRKSACVISGDPDTRSTMIRISSFAHVHFRRPDLSGLMCLRVPLVILDGDLGQEVEARAQQMVQNFKDGKVIRI